MSDSKCVLVLDDSLPVGLLANAAAVLSMSIGKRRPDLVGNDAWDGSGRRHAGLVQITVPILGASRRELADVVRRAGDLGSDQLLVVGFSDVAQRERTYDAYVSALADTRQDDLQYLGLGLCGTRSFVSALTGSFRLLR